MRYYLTVRASGGLIATCFQRYVQRCSPQLTFLNLKTYDLIVRVSSLVPQKLDQVLQGVRATVKTSLERLGRLEEVVDEMG